MPGNSIQVNSSGAIRVDSTGKIIVAASTDPCCCAATDCNLCPTESHAISVTFSGISVASWVTGGVTFDWTSAALANATFCVPWSISSCNYIGFFSGGTYTADGASCEATLQIHVSPSGAGTQFNVIMTLATKTGTACNVFPTAIGDVIFEFDTPAAFVACTTYTGGNGSALGQRGSGGSVSLDYTTAC